MAAEQLNHLSFTSGITSELDSDMTDDLESDLIDDLDSPSNLIGSLNTITHLGLTDTHSDLNTPIDPGLTDTHSDLNTPTDLGLTDTHSDLNTPIDPGLTDTHSDLNTPTDPGLTETHSDLNTSTDPGLTDSHSDLNTPTDPGLTDSHSDLNTPTDPALNVDNNSWVDNAESDHDGFQLINSNPDTASTVAEQIHNPLGSVNSLPSSHKHLDVTSSIHKSVKEVNHVKQTENSINSHNKLNVCNNVNVSTPGASCSNVNQLTSEDDDSQDNYLFYCHNSSEQDDTGDDAENKDQANNDHQENNVINNDVAISDKTYNDDHVTSSVLGERYTAVIPTGSSLKFKFTKVKVDQNKDIRKVTSLCNELEISESGQNIDGSGKSTFGNTNAISHKNDSNEQYETLFESCGNELGLTRSGEIGSSEEVDPSVNVPSDITHIVNSSQKDEIEDRSNVDSKKDEETNDSMAFKFSKGHTHGNVHKDLKDNSKLSYKIEKLPPRSNRGINPFRTIISSQERRPRKTRSKSDDTATKLDVKSSSPLTIAQTSVSDKCNTETAIVQSSLPKRLNRGMNKFRPHLRDIFRKKKSRLKSDNMKMTEKTKKSSISIGGIASKYDSKCQAKSILPPRANRGINKSREADIKGHTNVLKNKKARRKKLHTILKKNSRQAKADDLDVITPSDSPVQALASHHLDEVLDEVAFNISNQPSKKEDKRKSSIENQSESDTDTDSADEFLSQESTDSDTESFEFTEEFAISKRLIFTIFNTKENSASRYKHLYNIYKKHSDSVLLSSANFFKALKLLFPSMKVTKEYKTEFTFHIVCIGVTPMLEEDRGTPIPLPGIFLHKIFEADPCARTPSSSVHFAYSQFCYYHNFCYKHSTYLRAHFKRTLYREFKDCSLQRFKDLNAGVTEKPSSWSYKFCGIRLKVNNPKVTGDEEGCKDDVNRDVNKDDVNKGDVNMDNVSKDDINLDDVNKVDVNIDNISKDGVNQHDVNMDNVSKDDVNQDDVNKGDVNVDNISKNDVSKGDVKVDNVSKDDVNRSDIISNEGINKLWEQEFSQSKCDTSATDIEDIEADAPLVFEHNKPIILAEGTVANHESGTDNTTMTNESVVRSEETASPPLWPVDEDGQEHSNQSDYVILMDEGGQGRSMTLGDKEDNPKHLKNKEQLDYKNLNEVLQEPQKDNFWNSSNPRAASVLPTPVKPPKVTKNSSKTEYERPGIYYLKDQELKTPFLERIIVKDLNEIQELEYVGPGDIFDIVFVYHYTENEEIEKVTIEDKKSRKMCLSNNTGLILYSVEQSEKKVVRAYTIDHQTDNSSGISKGENDQNTLVIDFRRKRVKPGKVTFIKKINSRPIVWYGLDHYEFLIPRATCLPKDTQITTEKSSSTKSIPEIRKSKASKNTQVWQKGMPVRFTQDELINIVVSDIASVEKLTHVGDKSFSVENIKFKFHKFPSGAVYQISLVDKITQKMCLQNKHGQFIYYDVFDERREVMRKAIKLKPMQELLPLKHPTNATVHSSDVPESLHISLNSESTSSIGAIETALNQTSKSNPTSESANSKLTSSSPRNVLTLEDQTAESILGTSANNAQRDTDQDTINPNEDMSMINTQDDCSENLTNKLGDLSILNNQSVSQNLSSSEDPPVLDIQDESSIDLSEGSKAKDPSTLEMPEVQIGTACALELDADTGNFFMMMDGEKVFISTGDDTATSKDTNGDRNDDKNNADNDKCDINSDNDDTQRVELDENNGTMSMLVNGEKVYINNLEADGSDNVTSEEIVTLDDDNETHGMTNMTSNDHLTPDNLTPDMNNVQLIESSKDVRGSQADDDAVFGRDVVFDSNHLHGDQNNDVPEASLVELQHGNADVCASEFTIVDESGDEDEEECHLVGPEEDDITEVPDDDIIPLNNAFDRILCVICGEDATIGFHYGADTCSSCAHFFRKHVNNGLDTYRCDTKCCLITCIEKTANCKHCRLKKCLEVGMSLQTNNDNAETEDVEVEDEDVGVGVSFQSDYDDPVGHDHGFYATTDATISDETVTCKISERGVFNCSFQCGTCNYHCMQLDQFKKHFQSNQLHTYQCRRHGGKSFETFVEFARHTLTNHAVGAFHCTLCHVRCLTAGTLTTHLKTNHTQIKEFTCSFCPQVFIDRKLLSEHIQLHIDINHNSVGTGTYMCQICYHTCKSETSFEEHTETNHSNVRMRCRDCGKAMRTLLGYARHIRKYTVGYYKCTRSRCHFVNQSKQKVIQHAKQHKKSEFEIICLEYKDLQGHCRGWTQKDNLMGSALHAIKARRESKTTSVKKGRSRIENVAGAANLYQIISPSVPSTVVTNKGISSLVLQSPTSSATGAYCVMTATQPAESSPSFKVVKVTPFSVNNTGSLTSSNVYNAVIGTPASVYNTGSGTPANVYNTVIGTPASVYNTGSGTLTSVSNTVIGTAASVYNTGSGTPASVYSTGSGTLTSVSNTVIGTSASVYNTGSGTPASVYSTGSGTLTSVSNTVIGTSASVYNTGSGTPASVYSTGSGIPTSLNNVEMTISVNNVGKLTSALTTIVQRGYKAPKTITSTAPSTKTSIRPVTPPSANTSDISPKIRRPVNRWLEDQTSNFGYPSNSQTRDSSSAKSPLSAEVEKQAALELNRSVCDSAHLVCTPCGVELNNRVMFYVHKKQCKVEDGIKGKVIMYQCHTCGYLIRNVTLLKIHLNTCKVKSNISEPHNIPEDIVENPSEGVQFVYSCPICPYHMYTKRHLQMHLKRHKVVMNSHYCPVPGCNGSGASQLKGLYYHLCHHSGDMQKYLKNKPVASDLPCVECGRMLKFGDVCCSEKSRVTTGSYWDILTKLPSELLSEIPTAEEHSNLVNNHRKLRKKKGLNRMKQSSKGKKPVGVTHIVIEEEPVDEECSETDGLECDESMSESEESVAEPRPDQTDEHSPLNAVPKLGSSSNLNTENRFEVTVYLCKFCQFKTHYSLTIKSHLLKAHEQLCKKLLPFICPYCGFKANSNETIKLHQFTSHPEKDGRCMLVKDIMHNIETEQISYAEYVNTQRKRSIAPKRKYKLKRCHVKLKRLPTNWKAMIPKLIGIPAHTPPVPPVTNVRMLPRTPQGDYIVPNESVFRVDIQCPECSFRTKVRYNLLRHLKKGHTNNEAAESVKEATESSTVSSIQRSKAQVARGTGEPIETSSSSTTPVGTNTNAMAAVPDDIESQLIGFDKSQRFGTLTSKFLGVSVNSPSNTGKLKSDPNANESSDDIIERSPIENIPEVNRNSSDMNNRDYEKVVMDMSDHVFPKPQERIFDTPVDESQDTLKCSQCEYIGVLDSLKIHFYWNHTAYKQYRCAYCGLSSHEETHIITHCKFYHPSLKQKVQSVADNVIKGKSILNVNRLPEMIMCKIRTLSSASDRNTETRGTGDVPESKMSYKCMYCKFTCLMRIAIKRHCKTHHPGEFLKALLIKATKKQITPDIETSSGRLQNQGKPELQEDAVGKLPEESVIVAESILNELLCIVTNDMNKINEPMDQASLKVSNQEKTSLMSHVNIPPLVVDDVLHSDKESQGIEGGIVHDVNETTNIKNNDIQCLLNRMLDKVCQGEHFNETIGSQEIMCDPSKENAQPDSEAETHVQTLLDSLIDDVCNKNKGSETLSTQVPPSMDLMINDRTTDTSQNVVNDILSDLIERASSSTIDKNIKVQNTSNMNKDTEAFDTITSKCIIENILSDVIDRVLTVTQKSDHCSENDKLSNSMSNVKGIHKGTVNFNGEYEYEQTEINFSSDEEQIEQDDDEHETFLNFNSTKRANFTKRNNFTILKRDVQPNEENKGKSAIDVNQKEQTKEPTRTYICSYCKHFRSKHRMFNIQQHIWNKHLQLFEYGCKKCGKGFRSGLKQARKHCLTEHGSMSWLGKPELPKFIVEKVDGHLNYVGTREQIEELKQKYLPKKTSPKKKSSKSEEIQKEKTDSERRDVSYQGKMKGFVFCGICNSHHNELDQARQHVYDKHLNIQLYKCTMCVAKFGKLEKAKYHCKIFHKRQDYQHCLKTAKLPDIDHTIKTNDGVLFIGNSSLLTELRTARYRCGICCYESVSNPEIREHIMCLHMDELPFTCKLCNKRFSKKISTYVHLMNVHNSTSDSNILRDKSVKLNEVKLDDNVTVVTVTKHVGELPEKAHQKSPSLGTAKPIDQGNRKTQTTGNVAMSANETKYACSVCDFKSQQLITVREHIQYTHRKIYPFSCLRCSKGFIFKSGALLHIKVDHQIVDEKDANICLKENNLPSYSTHKINNDGIIFVEDGKNTRTLNQVGKPSETSAGWNPSIEISNDVEIPHRSKAGKYVCAVCGSTLSSEAEAVKHIGVMHLNLFEYRCTYCNLESSERATLESHHCFVNKGDASIEFTPLSVPKGAIKEVAHGSEVTIGNLNWIKINSLQKFDCPNCMVRGSKSSISIHLKHQHKNDGALPKERYVNMQLRKSGIKYLCCICRIAKSNKAKLRDHILNDHFRLKTYECTLCWHQEISKTAFRGHKCTPTKVSVDQFIVRPHDITEICLPELFTEFGIIVGDVQSLQSKLNEQSPCPYCPFQGSIWVTLEHIRNMHMDELSILWRKGLVFSSSDILQLKRTESQGKPSGFELKKIGEQKQTTDDTDSDATLGNRSDNSSDNEDKGAFWPHIPKDPKYENYPFKCAYCEFYNYTKRNINYHCRMRHKGQPEKWIALSQSTIVSSKRECPGRSKKRATNAADIKCGYCSYVTVSEADFNVHIRSHDLPPDVYVEHNDNQNSDQDEGIYVLNDSESDVDIISEDQIPNDGLAAKIAMVNDDKDTVITEKTNEEKREELTYICCVCSDQFTSKMLVVKHIRKIHLNELAFGCESCGLQSQTVEPLESHQCCVDSSNQCIKSLSHVIPASGEKEVRRGSYIIFGDYKWIMDNRSLKHECAHCTLKGDMLSLVSHMSHQHHDNTSLPKPPQANNDTTATSAQSTMDVGQPQNIVSDSEHQIRPLRRENDERGIHEVDDTLKNVESMVQQTGQNVHEVTSTSSDLLDESMNISSFEGQKDTFDDGVSNKRCEENIPDMQQKTGTPNSQNIFDIVSHSKRDNADNNELLEADTVADDKGQTSKVVSKHRCSMCNFSSELSINVYNHIMGAHLKENIYECVKCVMGFDSTKEARIHCKKLHGWHYAYKLKTVPVAIREKYIEGEQIFYGNKQWIENYISEHKADVETSVMKTTESNIILEENGSRNIEPAPAIDDQASADIYTCVVCEAYDANNKADVHTHIQVQHLKQKLFKCIECNIKLSSIEKLEHLDKVHGGMDPRTFIQRVHLSHQAQKITIRDGKKYIGHKNWIRLKMNKMKNEKITKKGKSSNDRSYLKAKVKPKEAVQRDEPKAVVPRKNFVCVVCTEYKTSSKANVYSHMKVKHLKMKLYKCTECGAGYNSSASKISHMNTAHGGVAVIERTQLPRHAHKLEEKDGEVLVGNLNWFTYQMNKLKHAEALSESDKELNKTQSSHIKKVVDSAGYNKDLKKGSGKPKKTKRKHTHSETDSSTKKRKRNEQTQFKCPRCSCPIPTMALLVSHMRTHFGYKPFICAYCSFACTTKFDMKFHIKGEHCDKPLEFRVVKDNLVDRKINKEILSVRDNNATHSPSIQSDDADIKLTDGDDQMAERMVSKDTAKNTKRTVPGKKGTGKRRDSIESNTSEKSSSSTIKSIDLVKKARKRTLSIESNASSASKRSNTSQTKDEVAEVEIKAKGPIYEDYPFKCPYCDFKQYEEFRIRKHCVKSHPDEAVKVISTDMNADAQPSSQVSVPAIKCGFCRFVTQDEDSFQTHLKTHNLAAQLNEIEEKPIKVDIKCGFCRYVTKSESDFQSHLVCHNLPAFIEKDLKESKDTQQKTSDNIHKCQLCLFTTTSKAVFENHQKIHALPKVSIQQIDNAHSRKPEQKTGLFKCSYCLFKSHYAKSVKKHCTVKHPNKSHRVVNITNSEETKTALFRCPYCPLETQYVATIKRHCRLKHTKKPVRVIDAKTGKFREDLITRKYKCKYCSKSFESKVAVQRHCREDHPKMKALVIDLGIDKPVKRFVEKNKDNVEDKAFSCKHCEYESFTWKEFEEHLMQHEKPTFKCPYCDLFYIHRSNIFRHCSRQHISKEKCAIRIKKGQISTIRPEPNYKTPLHELKCLHCKFRTFVWSKYEKHVMWHEQPTFKCSYCYFTSKQLQNILRHCDRIHSANERGAKKLHRGVTSEYKGKEGILSQPECESETPEQSEQMEKYYKCPHCNVKSKSRESIVYHCRKQHPRKEQIAPLEVCDAKQQQIDFEMTPSEISQQVKKGGCDEESDKPIKDVTEMKDQVKHQGKGNSTQTGDTNEKELQSTTVQKASRPKPKSKQKQSVSKSTDLSDDRGLQQNPIQKEGSIQAKNYSMNPKVVLYRPKPKEKQNILKVNESNTGTISMNKASPGKKEKSSPIKLSNVNQPFVKLLDVNKDYTYHGKRSIRPNKPSSAPYVTLEDDYEMQDAIEDGETSLPEPTDNVTPALVSNNDMRLMPENTDAQLPNGSSCSKLFNPNVEQTSSGSGPKIEQRREKSIFDLLSVGNIFSDSDNSEPIECVKEKQKTNTLNVKNVPGSDSIKLGKTKSTTATKLIPFKFNLSKLQNKFKKKNPDETKCTSLEGTAKHEPLVEVTSSTSAGEVTQKEKETTLNVGNSEVVSKIADGVQESTKGPKINKYSLEESNSYSDTNSAATQVSLTSKPIEEPSKAIRGENIKSSVDKHNDPQDPVKIDNTTTSDTQLLERVNTNNPRKSPDLKIDDQAEMIKQGHSPKTDVSDIIIMESNIDIEKPKQKSKAIFNLGNIKNRFKNFKTTTEPKPKGTKDTTSQGNTIKNVQNIKVEKPDDENEKDPSRTIWQLFNTSKIKKEPGVEQTVETQNVNSKSSVYEPVDVEETQHATESSCNVDIDRGGNTTAISAPSVSEVSDAEHMAIGADEIEVMDTSIGSDPDTWLVLDEI
ncbi:unnamed protein product [Owenia fusiformis]|uniref:Uncharacterized protein n=1 Tax=Owenia fusiformis TaxID=6347 RepID=A0A8J1TJR8_OWEFU|nr:unnamed protein product [Owenia fusiformis]